MVAAVAKGKLRKLQSDENNAMLWKKAVKDNERNMVVRLRQLALALTHQLAMVCLNHEYRVRSESVV